MARILLLPGAGESCGGIARAGISTTRFANGDSPLNWSAANWSFDT